MEITPGLLVQILGAAWALLMLGGFLVCLWRPTPGEEQSSRRQGRASGVPSWVLIALLALGVRLAPNALLARATNYDIESFEVVGNLVLQGRDVYTAPEAEKRYPYLPLQMVWMAQALRASRVLNLPYPLLVRLAPIVADAAIAALLCATRRRQGAALALRSGLAYALNPVSIYVSAYHGQFDAIPLLLILLAVASLGRSALLSGGWIGLAILSKSWPVLTLPALWEGLRSCKQTRFLLLASGAVPVIGTAIYCVILRVNPLTVLLRATGYDHGIGIFGYGSLIRSLTLVAPSTMPALTGLVSFGRFVTLAMLVLTWLWIGRKLAAPKGAQLMLMTFFAWGHAFAIQYLVWLLPLAIWNGEWRWLVRYTLAAFLCMFLTYPTLILSQELGAWITLPQPNWLLFIPTSLPVWLVTLAWWRSYWPAVSRGSTSNTHTRSS